MESVAVMGFAEVLRHLPEIHRTRLAIRSLLAANPNAIFLPIDSPGLNLALARDAHRAGLRVVYYVCPQIWAWGRGRVARLREDVDLTLLLFRFEEDLLRAERVACRWVGHPAGALRPDADARAAARRAFDVGDQESLIAVLPGSRHGEVRRHLAPMLDAAARLVNEGARPARVAVSDAGPVEAEARRGDAARLWATVRPIHHRGPAEPLLRAADVALVASGTATLEAAALGAPLVIVYRTGWLNYQIARRIVRLPSIGLANILAAAGSGWKAGPAPAPECVQGAATGPSIARAAAPLLADPLRREAQRAAFAGLSETLGGPGAAERAADALIEFAAASPAKRSA
jgi:lipid-A-disaccharide synthase